LYVNVSCTAATGYQPNCNYIYIYIYIYHRIRNRNWDLMLELGRSKAETWTPSQSKEDLLLHGWDAEVCLKYISKYMTPHILNCSCEKLKTSQVKKVERIVLEPSPEKEKEIRFYTPFTKWLIYTYICSIKFAWVYV
jgi:hypothetical protein